MSSILLLKGPVCTYYAIHQNGTPISVRRTVKSQFLRAANALAAANLGTLVQVNITSQNRANDVFIKKLPSEMKAALKDNTDLCSLEEYTSRFFMPTPACIRQPLRDELVRLQLVQREHFTESDVVPTRWPTYF